MKHPKLIDLSGQRFGQLSVIGQAGNTAGGAALWKCVCDCGNETLPTGSDLRNGKTTRCKSCSVKGRFLTHGATGTRLYRIWKNMRTRCRNQNAPGYKHYGGRGISICRAWSDYATFETWAIGNGYADDLSIERKNVNGNYTPSNCTWATPAVQSANRNYTKKNKAGDLWWHIAQKNGITRSAYATRVHDGWPMEIASTWPMYKARPGLGRNRNR